MRNYSVIIFGKSLSAVSKKLNLGHGSTWPGHLALKVNRHFIEDVLKKSDTKIIMVAGTNGKTTTARMIRTVLEGSNHAVIQNESGANLLNGIASTLLLQSTPRGKIRADYVIFEVDENALPNALSKITPDYLILLNLFRDQLDRYGEVDSIAKKWKEAIKKLDSKTTLILNADDPQVAYLGQQAESALYFGMVKKSLGNISEHAADSLYCPRCGTKLSYLFKTYSHLGNWHCRKCELQRPEIEKITVPYLPLSGGYNEYNTTSVVLLAKQLGLTDESIEKGLRNVMPAFGRQEVIELGNKKAQLFLSKNPTGFNESLRTIAELKARHILLLLNDRTADGHDVSWIWDVDFETFLPKFESITISGDRAYDMALRIKYSEKLETRNSKLETFPLLTDAINHALSKTPASETLYILPTYTAMLETRKILKGRKIL
jgi:UDP-N-acetylmuramyl tripeptide synthase